MTTDPGFGGGWDKVWQEALDIRGLGPNEAEKTQVSIDCRSISCHRRSVLTSFSIRSGPLAFDIIVLPLWLSLHDGAGIYITFCKRVTLRGNYIYDIVDTGGSHGSYLLGASDRGENARSEQQRNLNGRAADAAGSSVYVDASPFSVI